MKGKLVGVHKVAKVKDPKGPDDYYYYAWRGKGAPRMQAKPGTKAFTLEYVRLTKDRVKHTAAGTLASMIAEFRASAGYLKLSPSTRRDYERQLSVIIDAFGDMPIRAIEERGSRRLFLEWRDTMKATPRTADMHIALLARVFAWAKGNEIILRNPLERVERLHEGSRRDIIWSLEQIETVLTGATEHIRNVALMALWTMQRQADLLTMPTLAFDGERIAVKQHKTGARVRVRAAADILPILQDAKATGRQRVLVNSFGQNWTSSGFRASWRKEMKRLGILGVTFHDLRGTAITFAYAKLDASHDEKIKMIAEISGHSKDDAEAIIRRHYLAGEAVIDAIGRGTRGE